MKTFSLRISLTAMTALAAATSAAAITIVPARPVIAPRPVYVAPRPAPAPAKPTPAPAKPAAPAKNTSGDDAAQTPVRPIIAPVVVPATSHDDCDEKAPDKAKKTDCKR